ncbi:hypothetical protein NDU88_002028 [Pleurodeles waltl]|uniref:Uncharacterized protein n=1 Tax=Pleurodeles waltl TaxID=8319 RepID=A0AAV7SAP2_PLEWA|nr:hypothetical protein NDU88_002028 [Pleurodeles waltl]
MQPGQGSQRKHRDRQRGQFQRKTPPRPHNQETEKREHESSKARKEGTPLPPPSSAADESGTAGSEMSKKTRRSRTRQGIKFQRAQREEQREEEWKLSNQGSRERFTIGKPQRWKSGVNTERARTNPREE